MPNHEQIEKQEGEETPEVQPEGTLVQRLAGLGKERAQVKKEGFLAGAGKLFGRFGNLMKRAGKVATETGAVIYGATASPEGRQLVTESVATSVNETVDAMKDGMVQKAEQTKGFIRDTRLERIDAASAGVNQKTEQVSASFDSTVYTIKGLALERIEVINKSNVEMTSLQQQYDDARNCRLWRKAAIIGKELSQAALDTENSLAKIQDSIHRERTGSLSRQRNNIYRLQDRTEQLTNKRDGVSGAGNEQAGQGASAKVEMASAF